MQASVHALALLFALVFTLAGSSRSQAGTLSLDFDFEGSGTLFSGIPFLVGGSAAGTTTVILRGVDSLGAPTVQSARGELRRLQETIRVEALFASGSGDLQTAQGTVRFDQIGAASGTFDGASLVVPTFRALVFLSFDDTFPFFVGPRTSTRARSFSPLVFGLMGLGQPGAAQLTGAIGFSGMESIPFTGREIARRFEAAQVPEPIAGLSLLAGAALLRVALALARARGRAISRGPEIEVARGALMEQERSRG